jgi:hypothetical protein
VTKISAKTADLFNRSVLDMSFTLLRNKEPKLALLIRNILFNVTISKSEQAPENKNADLFKIELKPSQVNKIVNNLNQILEENLKIDPTKNTSIFRPVIIESIVKEWTNLALFLKSNSIK